MTSPFQRVYPNTGEGRVTLDGGLNSKFPRSLILDNESPDCLNVVYSEGGVETREGSTKINTASVGSFVFDGLYTRKGNNDVETMVAFANGSAYTLDSTSFITIPSAQSVYTSGNRVGAALYENHLFSGDGQAIPYKYDGVDWTRHGVYPPTTTHTAATNSNGTLSGDYQYKIVFVNTSTVESDVGPVNATFTAASEEILVSSIPVAPQSFGISSRNIYRTENGGTSFKFLDSLADNTTTTYVDNKSDSQLGVAAPLDQGVPPNYDVITYAYDRLFVNDPTTLNYIKYSEVAEPYTFKTTNFRRVGDNTSDLVRTITKYNNGILVTGDKTMTLIYMPDTSDDTTWVNIVLTEIDFGCKSPYGITEINNRLVVPLSDDNKFSGFGTIAGTTLKPETTFNTVQASGSEFNSYKIEDQMGSVVSSQMKNISAIEYKNKIYISLTYGSGETQNNRIYVLNFQKDNLSKVQKFSWAPWTGLSISQFCIYDNKIYGASSLGDGFVYQLNDGTYNDDGSAIDSYMWTKEFVGFKGEENYHKDFKQLYMLIEKVGAWFMDLYIRIDSDTGGGDKYQIDLDPGGSLWGVVVGGRDDWGGSVLEEDYKQTFDGHNGKRIQFKFTNQNTLDQRFRVNWLKYVYNRKGLR